MFIKFNYEDNKIYILNWEFYLIQITLDDNMPKHIEALIFGTGKEKFVLFSAE